MAFSLVWVVNKAFENSKQDKWCLAVLRSQYRTRAVHSVTLHKHKARVQKLQPCLFFSPCWGRILANSLVTTLLWSSDKQAATLQGGNTVRVGSVSYVALWKGRFKGRYERPAGGAGVPHCEVLFWGFERTHTRLALDPSASVSGFSHRPHWTHIKFPFSASENYTVAELDKSWIKWFSAPSVYFLSDTVGTQSKQPKTDETHAVNHTRPFLTIYPLPILECNNDIISHSWVALPILAGQPCPTNRVQPLSVGQRHVQSPNCSTVGNDQPEKKLQQ